MKSKFVLGSKVVLGSNIVLGVIASTVLMFGFVFVFFISNQSTFCGLCHEMGRDYRAWIMSTHTDVPCTSCHIGPGMINLTHHKYDSFFRDVIPHYLNSFKHPINANSELSKELPSINCTQSTCHDAPKKKEYHAIIFDHSKHKEANCAYCHNRIAHSALTPYEFRATMDFCENCHKENNATTACLSCHVPSKMQKPSYHYASNWTKNHESSVKRDCLFCHVRGFCRNCHALNRAIIAKSW